MQDARSSLLDEWHKESPDLVVLIGRDLLNSLRLPYINTLSATSPSVELLAGQLILSSEMIGGLPVYVAPFFPKDAILITAFSNLSIYYLLGGLRRLVREEPEYNRLAVYQSSVDGYVVEDLGKVALIDKLTFAKPKPQAPIRRKKGRRGRAAKAEVKKTLLPAFSGWIEGTLESDSGRQDEVIVTLMVWEVDCGDLALALRLGAYVVRHRLMPPDIVKRHYFDNSHLRFFATYQGIFCNHF